MTQSNCSFSISAVLRISCNDSLGKSSWKWKATRIFPDSFSCFEIGFTNCYISYGNDKSLFLLTSQQYSPFIKWGVWYMSSLTTLVNVDFLSGPTSSMTSPVFEGRSWILVSPMYTSAIWLVKIVGRFPVSKSFMFVFECHSESKKRSLLYNFVRSSSVPLSWISSIATLLESSSVCYLR